MSETNTVERPVVSRIAIVGAGAQLGHIKQLLESSLIEMEVGTIDQFVIHASPDSEQMEVYAAPSLSQPTHGPQRKGRGGKIRRW